MSVLRRQGALLICAVQFLTRAPTPPLRGFQPGWIAASTRYFSLVGQGVGAICGLVLVVAAQALDGALPALLAVAVGVLLTGGFHEDGLADTADGLGGGQDRAARLTIMKDSRVGTYGVLALVLTLAARVGALAALEPWIAASCLVAAHGLGRAAAVAAMAVLPYAGAPDMAKEGPPSRAAPRDALAAAALALWPLLLLPPLAGAVGVGLGLALAAATALAAWRLIGGRTGDVLGAVEQLFEVGFLLACAALLAA